MKRLESLENERSSFSKLSVALPTSQLIVQPFRCFTYVTDHFPTFFRFSYLTGFSLTSPGEPPMMEGLPWWGFSSMPGLPLRQHKHERRYTLGTYSFIPTRRIWNYDNGGQMIFGDLVGLNFPEICLTGKEDPRVKPHPGNLSRPGIEHELAARQARMLPPVPQRWTGGPLR